jgi:phage terminase large subunit-like protein
MSHLPTLNEVSELLPYLTKRELGELDWLLTDAVDPWLSTARPSQLPPPGDWVIWLILAGRGFGKTRCITEWARMQAQAQPGSRGAIVGATAADTRDVLIEGASGIMAISPDNFRPQYESSKRRLTWPNGSVATLFSADEPNRLRGPQQHWAICDELAAWRYPETWDMLMFGLRLGQTPRVAVATTPRPIPIIKQLIKDPTAVIVRGSTYENRDNLAPSFFQQVVSRYENTRLGRQELNAEILEDVPGALWTRAIIDDHRVTRAPDLVRVVVGVDPAASTGETGIVVAGRGADGHAYLLEDLTTAGSPDTWGRQVVTAYHKYQADRAAVEANNGGDMVISTIQVVDKTVATKKLWASRGKATRAEPVAALYEQGKVHHVGMFAGLEDEYCTWVSGEGMDSPNRLDAAVWALTELMLLDRGPVEFNESNPFYG